VEQVQIIQEEISKLLQKQAISITHPSEQCFTPTYSWFQKRWGTATSYQPQGTESVCASQALQNGRYPYLAGPSETRGLVGKSGLKRSILYNSHTPHTQETSQVHVSGEHLPVQLSPIQPVFSTMGAQKTLKSSLTLL